jgi:hypothetical protein
MTALPAARPAGHVRITVPGLAAGRNSLRLVTALALATAVVLLGLVIRGVTANLGAGSGDVPAPSSLPQASPPAPGPSQGS